MALRRVDLVPSHIGQDSSRVVECEVKLFPD